MADETVTVVRAPSEKTAGYHNAFEVGLGIGYSQPTGDVGAGLASLGDVAGPGAALELNLGWRINPTWLFGVYGTTAWFSRGSNPGRTLNNWSATAGLHGNYHFLPGESFDPWIGLGAGWRGHWVNTPDGRDSRHGLDVARLQFGLDIPVTSTVSVSPFAGATASLFLIQLAPQRALFSVDTISSPKVNFFFTAGVMGRFDLHRK